MNFPTIAIGTNEKPNYKRMSLALAWYWLGQNTFIVKISTIWCFLSIVIIFKLDVKCFFFHDDVYEEFYIPHPMIPSFPEWTFHCMLIKSHHGLEHVPCNDICSSTDICNPMTTFIMMKMHAWSPTKLEMAISSSILHMLITLAWLMQQIFTSIPSFV